MRKTTKNGITTVWISPTGPLAPLTPEDRRRREKARRRGLRPEDLVTVPPAKSGREIFPLPWTNRAVRHAEKLRSKEQLTIRIDHDIAEWLRQPGSRYQTR